MAVDKLVDSTQLDSDLTSVANAIRTKGGTSAQLAFPAGFVSAIGAIPTGGGGQKYVGEFTLLADGYMPGIQHNLGTQKVAVLVFPKNNSTITPHAGYITWSIICININALLADTSVVLDYTVYNGTKFPNQLTKTVGTDTGFRFANGNPSPWTSQSTWDLGTFYGTTDGHTFTDNTYKYTAAKMASGSYNIIIWSLEE